jgi:2,4-dienoyl-CoA reductase-like NADH-dependent reductase (Old Yellow Enzyme family)/thioredoxin reductase
MESKLLETNNLGKLQLQNRLIMATIKTGFGNAKGEITQRHIDFYVRRAQGGVALIIPEPMFVHLSGRELPTQIGIHDDSLIPQLKKIVGDVHRAGAKIAAQLNHAGRVANPKATKQDLLSASNVTCPRIGVEPKEMTTEQIKRAQQWFVDAARRAMQAGLDAIELQFGHGLLLAQFLSTHTNKRNDDYGGPWENRVKFGLEILTKIRSQIGPDFPIIVRISGEEYFEGGLILDDSIRLSKELEENGATAIHVGGGSACETLPWYFQQMSLPKGKFWQDAIAIKKEISLPVIAVGRINEPQDMANLLGQGIDYIAMARPLVTDPDLPNKIKTGNSILIRRCTACLDGCFTNIRKGKGLHCALNPMVGREGEIKIEKAQVPQKVFVIGGGVAGMEAAIIAAERGHQITLFEKDKLGGQYNLASIPPGKHSLEVVKDNMIAVLEQVGVSVKTGEKIEVDDIIQQNPDVVIIATGVEPIIPDIDGMKDIQFYSAFDILGNHQELGERVLVIGGGLIGMETAEYLAQQGKNITVVEMLAEVAGDMELLAKNLMMKRLKNLPVTILTDSTVSAFTQDGVHIKTPNGLQKFDHFDTVVIAVGTKRYDLLSKPLQDQGF